MKKEINIKKEIMIRSLIGSMGGIVISQFILIGIALVIGDGTFYSCVPNLIEAVGTETGAVILQTVLSAVLGAVCGGASVIWELDHWSLVKQTLLYFTLLAGAMLPVAYMTHWMEHSIKGILTYVGIFLGIFLLIWIVKYMIWKVKIDKLNRDLKREFTSL